MYSDWKPGNLGTRERGNAGTRERGNAGTREPGKAEPLQGRHRRNTKHENGTNTSQNIIFVYMATGML